MIRLKTAGEIDKMARAGALVGTIFEDIEALLIVGTTTGEIDDRIAELMAVASAEPLFLNYQGFPAHSCISINNEIVHGIPGQRQLEPGDIVTVDIGVRLDGYCGDAARTTIIGTASESAIRLVECCREALSAGIAQACPGNRLSAVSAAIAQVVAASPYSVVEQYVGHGIGREMHEEPQVPNFVSADFVDGDLPLEPGLVIAIEPMVTEGSPKTMTLEDGWTVVTEDGLNAAHCEHTVAVTSQGPRILTCSSGASGRPPKRL